MLATISTCSFPVAQLQYNEWHEDDFLAFILQTLLRYLTS